MIAFLYLIPLAACLYLYLELSPWLGWYWYVGIILLSWGLTWALRRLFMRLRTNAVEYVSSYITSIRFYESWTERVVWYEEIEVPDGEDSQGHTIYRTERVQRERVDHHPEEYYEYTNTGRVYSINRKIYNEIANLWDVPSRFLFVDHPNAIDDGDAEEYLFQDCFCGNNFDATRLTDGIAYKFVPYTETHSYVNRVQGSNSIFHFQKITKEKAQELELFEYPKLDHSTQNPILGRAVDETTVNAFRLFNAYYGKDYQIHVFVLLFEGKDLSIVEKQRSYWNGGNKNEFVVCLGVNGDKVEWCKTFSWMDEPTLGVKTEAWFLQHPDLDLLEFNHWLCEHITDWKRKEFHDFDYVHVELKGWQQALLTILVAALNVGCVCLAEYLYGY